MKNLLLILSISISYISNSQVPSYAPGSGLVGWWPFTGNANDQSGNNLNGIVSGATLTTDRLGNTNAAYSFNGTTSQISIADNNLLDLTQFTVSAWVNSVTNPILAREIVAKGQYPYNYGMNVNGTNNNLSGFYNSNGTYQEIISSATSPINTWTHVLISHDGAQAKLFVNGVLQSSLASQPAIVNSDILYIGRTYTGYYMNGKIDDLGIWNRALTNCEISDLYHSQLNWLQVSAGTDESICPNDAVLFSGTGNAINYTWSPVVGDGIPHVFTVMDIGTVTYTVTGTDATGCTFSDDRIITVNPNPSVSAGGDISICEGNQIILTATGDLASYTWDNGVQNGVPFSQGIGAVTYTVTAETIAGCLNTAQTTVTVIENPIVYGGPDVLMCEGGSISLTGSGTATTYNWDNSVFDGISFSPTQIGSTTYTVIGTDNSGLDCTSSDDVVITVIQNSIATQTQTALDSYTWPINSQTYTTSGSYIAVIPNQAGCDSTITLDLSLDFTGVIELNDATLSVSPNPVQDVMTISTEISLIGEQFTIYNQLGSIIFEGTIKSEKMEIDLSKYSTGVYLFKLNNYSEKVIRILKK